MNLKAIQLKCILAETIIIFEFIEYDTIILISLTYSGQIIILNE